MDPCLCLSIWNHWQASRWMRFPLFLPLNKHVARRSRIQVQLLCTLHLAMLEAAIYDQYCSLPPGARRNGNVLIPLLQSSHVVPVKKNCTLSEDWSRASIVTITYRQWLLMLISVPLKMSLILSPTRGNAPMECKMNTVCYLRLHLLCVMETIK